MTGRLRAHERELREKDGANEEAHEGYSNPAPDPTLNLLILSSLERQSNAFFFTLEKLLHNRKLSDQLDLQQQMMSFFVLFFYFLWK